MSQFAYSNPSLLGGNYDIMSPGGGTSFDAVSGGSNSFSADPFGADTSYGLGFTADPFGADDSYNLNTADPFGADTSYGLNYAGDPFGADSFYNMQADPFGADTSYNLSPTETYGADPFGADDSYGRKGNQFLQAYQNAVRPLQPFLKNPIVSTLMALNPTTALARMVLGGPQSVGGFLGSMFSNNPLGKLAGAVGGSQLANYATNGEFASMSPQTIGGIAGSLYGMASGNPYGATLGSLLGNQYGSGGQGGTGPNMLTTGTNDGFLGAIGTAGMGLNNNRIIGNQIKTLEGLFGQDSPYAQQMRQQLERRDAAAGRRSQYGTREVELQAALAGNAAKLQPGLQQLYGQKMGNTNLVLQSLLRNPSVISNATSGLKDAAGWLSNLFSGSSPAAQNPVWSGGGFQGGTEGMGD